ncbi:MAG TPA: hypothetical protein VK766_04080, partial [Cytophagaceae bacterium]|nr:hypothetical protein [Cytophagaceae bacterium]
YVVRSAPLIDNKRTFNSWDIGIRITCKEEMSLASGFNQEEISSLSKIIQDVKEENPLAAFIKSFLHNDHVNLSHFE